MSVLLAFAVVMLQFSAVDDIFKYECNYPKCKEILLEMNNQADSGSEKAEILWRLSRVSLMLGESAVDIESKRLHFKDCCPSAPRSEDTLRPAAIRDIPGKYPKTEASPISIPSSRLMVLESLFPLAKCWGICNINPFTTSNKDTTGTILCHRIAAL